MDRRRKIIINEPISENTLTRIKIKKNLRKKRDSDFGAVEIPPPRNDRKIWKTD